MIVPDGFVYSYRAVMAAIVEKAGHKAWLECNDFFQYVNTYFNDRRKDKKDQLDNEDRVS